MQIEKWIILRRQTIFGCDLRFRWRREKCPTRLHAFSLAFLIPFFFFCISFIASSRLLRDLREIWTFQFLRSSMESKRSLVILRMERPIRAPARFLAQFSTRLFSLNGSVEEDPWSVLPRRENFRKFVERSFSLARRILTRVLLIAVLTQRNALRVYMRMEKFS